MTKSLSAPQEKFLRECLTEGFSRTPFTGNRGAGSWASAWYRTARSLHRRELVTLERMGDGLLAKLTDAGRDIFRPVCAHRFVLVTRKVAEVYEATLEDDHLYVDCARVTELGGEDAGQEVICRDCGREVDYTDQEWS